MDMENATSPEATRMCACKFNGRIPVLPPSQPMQCDTGSYLQAGAPILVQVKIYRRLLTSSNDHLDQSEANDIP